MSVLIVDWLGRGGIAQCTEAWRIELESHGRRVFVVTRPRRELRNTAPVEVRQRRGRLQQHRELAHAAAAAVIELRPTTVIVQNYVVPLLEQPVYLAARRVGARVATVVHDHRLHSVFAGTSVGLRWALQRSDVVVAHSEFVGRELADSTSRAVTVLPLPVPIGMVGERQAVRPRRHPLHAVHFGILKRRYKGSDTFLEIARRAEPGWQFSMVGTGARVTQDVAVERGYVSGERLVELVRSTAATLLPYRVATQSGAAALSQTLGSVVVASALGGISEQVRDGETGILVPAEALVTDWLAVLKRLEHDSVRETIAERAADAVWAAHGCFVSGAMEIAS